MRFCALEGRPLGKRVPNPLRPGFLALFSRTLALGLAVAGAVFAQSISIATSSLPQGSVGSLYQSGLSVSGGTPPYKWTATGSVPPGLTVFSSGAIQGVPTTAGSYSFVLSVTDANGLTASKSFAVTITGPVLSITTTSPLPNASVGLAYSQTLAASNGTPPLPVGAGAGMPPGLTSTPRQGSSRELRPTAGNYTFTVQVTDSANNSAARTFALTVKIPALTITTLSPLFNGTVGVGIQSDAHCFRRQSAVPMVCHFR